MNESGERYLEDFAVGQTSGSGRTRIDGDRALAFAAEFDPQPFHLDEAAARHSIFGGLTAAPNDHPEPERRARDGVCREHGRTAPQGHLTRH